MLSPLPRLALLAALVLTACGTSVSPSGGDGGDAPSDDGASANDGPNEADGSSPADEMDGTDGSTLPDGGSEVAGDGGGEDASDGGGEDASDGGGETGDVLPPASINLQFTGSSVRKVVRLAGGLLVLIDVPLDLRVDWGFPKRELR